MTGDTKYTIPPDGWDCSRVIGHDGPCAASPSVSEAFASIAAKVKARPKTTIVSCPTYTDHKLAFGLYKEQSEAIEKWKLEHNIECHGGPRPYGGAIGGGFTYCFTGTSIGQVVTVQCHCGERIDVSDYDQW